MEPMESPHSGDMLFVYCLSKPFKNVYSAEIRTDWDFAGDFVPIWGWECPHMGGNSDDIVPIRGWFCPQEWGPLSGCPRLGGAHSRFSPMRAIACRMLLLNNIGAYIVRKSGRMHVVTPWT